MSDPVPLIAAAEAARRLCVSQRTILRWGKLGILDARRVGPKLIRYTEESVEAAKRKEPTAA